MAGAEDNEDNSARAALDAQEALRLIAEQRAGTAAQIEDLTRDLAGLFDAATSVATDDEHDPEGSTIAFERAQVVALLTHARNRLADLDRAAGRVADGTFGICDRCGRPIGAERLGWRPAAGTCIACANSS